MTNCKYALRTLEGSSSDAEVCIFLDKRGSLKNCGERGGGQFCANVFCEKLLAENEVKIT